MICGDNDGITRDAIASAAGKILQDLASFTIWRSLSMDLGSCPDNLPVVDQLFSELLPFGVHVRRCPVLDLEHKLMLCSSE